MEDFYKQRVIVYVDGFNFYYGLREPNWKRYYWLDMVKLFEQFIRPHQELVAVKYFSARPTNKEKSKRQDAFFQANLENPKFKLILGQYLKKRIECFKCRNIINTYEEKETDVRISTQIIADAYQQNCEVAVIVSADSDMLPAIELAQEAQQSVFVYFPPNQYSANLAAMSKGYPVHLQNYESRFRKSLLPDTIHLKRSNFDLTIPEKWKEFQAKKTAE